MKGGERLLYVVWSTDMWHRTDLRARLAGLCGWAATIQHRSIERRTLQNITAGWIHKNPAIQTPMGKGGDRTAGMEGWPPLHGIIGSFGYRVDRDPIPFSDDGGNPPIVI